MLSPTGWADDLLEPIINDMSGGLADVFGISLTSVLSSPEEYSYHTHVLMATIGKVVVVPAATVLLVILCMLELHRVMLITDGEEETRLRMIVFSCIKFGLLWAVFHATPTVMAGLYSLFAGIAVETNTLLTASTAAGSSSFTAQFLEAVDDMDWLGQTILVVVMLFAWIINKGAVLAALGLVAVRFVKLYLFSAFASLPMALLASEQTRSFGVNFLRNYGAVVLQAFVMVLAFAIFGSISKDWVTNALATPATSDIGMALQLGGIYMFMGIVLGMIMLGSGRLANELLGA